MTVAHGRHIKVLGEGSAERLRDPQQVRTMLEELVTALGMRCLGQPHMYEVEEEISKMGVEPFEDEGGVTGVAVLSTSHCAIHTWPLRRFFVMDVYSCRDFDPNAVEHVLAKHLQAHRLRISDLSESLHYPADVELSSAGAVIH
jgi:S-adenosylmethionine decarboxylase